MFCENCITTECRGIIINLMRMITKKDIESNDQYEIRYYTGNTVFKGCQCYSDCNCRNDFKSQVVDHYTLTVLKKKKSKTFYYNTLEEVDNHIKNL